MSNDLISRNAVIQIIQKEINRTASYLEHDTQINILNAVESLPAAYDVNKVVEQLKERMCSIEDEITDVGCYMRNLHFRDAVEIVSNMGGLIE